MAHLKEQLPPFCFLLLKLELIVLWLLMNTIHYENPKPTASIICMRDNELLLAKRAFNPAKGEWGLPGGFMELNETLNEAAERELKEETSIKNVELIQDMDGILPYELPKHLLGIIWKGKYKGQKHSQWIIFKSN